MEVTHTARGFELVKFADIYNEPCTLQESSLADCHAIWFGAGDNRMHLDANLLGQILPHIDRMLGTTLTTENAALAARVEALEEVNRLAGIAARWHWFGGEAVDEYEDGDDLYQDIGRAREVAKDAARAALAGDPS